MRHADPNQIEVSEESEAEEALDELTVSDEEESHTIDVQCLDQEELTPLGICDIYSHLT